MLARELVLGPELGEDADHRPAEQIATVGVGLGGDRRLKPLECGLRIARIPGGEGVRKLGGGLRVDVAVCRGEPRPRRQSLGEKVSGQGFEQLGGLLVLTAFEQDPSETRGGP